MERSWVCLKIANKPVWETYLRNTLFLPHILVATNLFDLKDKCKPLCLICTQMNSKIIQFQLESEIFFIICLFSITLLKKESYNNIMQLGGIKKSNKKVRYAVCKVIISMWKCKNRSALTRRSKVWKAQPFLARVSTSTGTMYLGMWFNRVE